ncbi:MAG: glycan-binding surface protein [Mangrovibacterium sp.]
MKNIIKTILFLFVVAVAVCACDDDNRSDSTPVVKYVRSTDAAASDSLLVSASMGQTIAIIGEGLEDVVSVIFNDQTAKLNPVYVTSSSIVVTIPGTIPEVVSNTFTLNTANGKSTVYDFIVVITSPQPESISCEWAPDGSTATIYGNYFFAREDGSIDVLFPGNLEATVSFFDETSVTVTVPEGSLAGYITITNDYGTGRSQFIFRDETGIFIDGENPSVWNNRGLSAFDSTEGIDGQYVKFDGTTGAWAWPANALQLFYINPENTQLVSEGEVSDYALKFECYCHEWHDTPLLVWFSNDDDTHNVDGEDAQYHWRPYLNNGTAENFVTDGWITVTMPLEDFVYNKDESETTRAISGLDKLQNLNMMWFGAIQDGSTEFGLNVWIDNVRLVKIN